MSMQWQRVLGVLAVLLVMTPLAVFSQDWRRADRWNIHVTNDWENTVRVTLWNERGGQLSSRTWTIHPGQSALLADDTGRSLRVGGSDKIKVGDDWEWVDIGSVGQRQGRTWHVNVRNIWQA